jgi:magnesium chelatase family protein
VAYPASIQLVAAMNPCRCGMAGAPAARAACRIIRRAYQVR